MTKLDISRPGHFSTGTFPDRDISGPGFSKCDFSIVSGYLMLGEMWRMHNEYSTTFLLSLAPSDLMLGEMSRTRDESDFYIVSGSQ